MKIIAISMVGPLLLWGNLNAQTHKHAKEMHPKKTMLHLAEKLESCEPYSQSFKHPMTGERLKRRIAGIVDGKCLFIEEMPNGGKMECRYSEAARKAVAQYYRIQAEAKSVKSTIKISMQTGESATTETVDNKKVENPLQKAMTDGTCTISGYGTQ